MITCNREFEKKFLYDGFLEGRALEKTSFFFITFLGMSAIQGIGRLEKISIWISSSYIAPATAAPPHTISVENHFSIIPFYRCLIRDFYSCKKGN